MVGILLKELTKCKYADVFRVLVASNDQTKTRVSYGKMIVERVVKACSWCSDHFVQRYYFTCVTISL